MVESLEMRKRLCCGSMESELHISRKVVHQEKVFFKLLNFNRKAISINKSLSRIYRDLFLSVLLICRGKIRLWRYKDPLVVVAYSCFERRSEYIICLLAALKR